MKMQEKRKAEWLRVQVRAAIDRLRKLGFKVPRDVVAKLAAARPPELEWLRMVDNDAQLLLWRLEPTRERAQERAKRRRDRDLRRRLDAEVQKAKPDGLW